MWGLNDCILFIVFAEQWKRAYLGKELLWGKKKKTTGYQTTFSTSLERPERTKPKIIPKLNHWWSHIIKDLFTVVDTIYFFQSVNGNIPSSYTNVVMLLTIELYLRQNCIHSSQIFPQSTKIMISKMTK